MSTVHLVPAPRAAARAALATVEIMLGVTLAHSWAGGSLPSLFGLLVLAGLVFGGSLLLFGGRVRLRTLVAAVAVAQLGLHTVFELAAPAHHAATTAGPVHLTWQMAVAHLAATVLTVLVWRAQHRAAGVIIDLITVRPVPGPVRATRRTGAAGLGFRPAHRTLLAGTPLRGPPLPS